MRLFLTQGQRGATAALALLLGTIALLAVMVARDTGLSRVLPLVLCVVVLVTWRRALAGWRNLVTGLLLVILFIPIKRYNLPVNLPFQLEPYRIVVAVLALFWILAMLVDPRVRLRRTGLDVPLGLVLLASLLSDAVNPGRVGPLSTDVVKAQTFFLSFFIVLYLVVSLVRTRVDLEHFVRLLAGGGGFIAFAGIVERRTGYNVFDHLHTIFPLLHHIGGGERFRSGRLRVLGPSQHPIALSVLFVVLLPLVIYLARRSRPWLLVAFLYVIAIFSTASRTGIIGLLVLAIVYLVLQPRTVLRAWPMVIPLLAVVHVAAPGAVGTIRETLNPGRAIAQQQHVVPGRIALDSGRLSDLGPSLHEWSNKPLLGEGFGTRIPSGPDANSRLLDDEWLGTLLETGYIGFLAWIWLFVLAVRRLGRAAAAAGDSDDAWLLTGFTAALVAFPVTMFFYDAFSFIQNAFMCFILLGLSSAYLNIRAREAAADATG